MAEQNNATCSICGKPYRMCLSCKDTLAIRPWQRYTCTSEHFKVFQVLRGFSTGVYTKDEAKSKFENINLDDLNTFRPHIKTTIEDIIKEPIVEKIVDETDKSSVETKSVIDSDKPVVEKTTNYRKKNYKVETY